MNEDNYKIHMLKPHPTEAIVVDYVMGEIDFETVHRIVDNVKNQFPNNVVIALPDKVSLESCSKDILENVISMITEIIDEKL